MIEYTSVDQQIEKLLSQKLLIPNKEYAKIQLSTFGYSNLIKSYRDPYVIIEDGRKVYRSNIVFNQISSLYHMDKELRNSVMSAMQDLEEHVKELAAEVIASSFGTHQDQYLLFRNYQNKKKRKKRFSLTYLLDKMRETIDTDKNPINHYKTNYGSVPPWILFKSVYFSTIVNFIDQFKRPEKIKLAHLLYDSSEYELNDDQLIKLMMDSLFLCLDYRNMAAHGGRIYNYDSDRKIRTDEIFQKNRVIPQHGFSRLLFALSVLQYHAPFERLNHTLNTVINKHCSAFPEDTTYLSQTLNVSIIPQNIVWISGHSNKYHTSQHCSGMSESIKISFEEAQSGGFIPCKRCCR